MTTKSIEFSNNKTFHSFLKKIVVAIITISILSSFPVISSNNQLTNIPTEPTLNIEEVNYEGIGLNTIPLSNPPVTIEIKVRKNPSDPWTTSKTAPIDTVLEFRIVAKNTKLLPKVVTIINTLPDNLDYVEGSANKEPDEYFENGTDEVLVWIKTIAGLTKLTITYKAKIVAVGEGENYVTVAPLTGGDPDEDSVTITGTSNPPYQPSNPDPSDGETDVEVDHNLSWEGGDPNQGENITYDVYFDDSSPPIYNSTIGPYPANQTNISFDPGTLDPNTVYYWKIVAEDNHGVKSTSDEWSFTTENNPPNTPGDPDPEDGDTGIDINADLSWTGGDPDGDIVYYDVFFDTVNPPTNQVATDITATTFDPGTMNFDETYYWKIVAEDEYGAETLGPIWSFTTGEDENDPPNEPSNPFPEDDKDNVELNVDLSWDCSDPNNHELFYDVYFEANNPDPNVLISENQTETTCNPGDLEYNTDYYWCIKAIDEKGASTMGPVWHFTTIKQEFEADLQCNGNLLWKTVVPGDTVDGSFTIKNNGEAGSLLDWEIIDWPKDWGSWTFELESGEDLKPEDEPVTVEVTVIAPAQGNQQFTGKIKIQNKENPDDACTIDVSLTTPKNKAFNFYLNVLKWLFEQFPNVFPILRQLLEL